MAGRGNAVEGGRLSLLTICDIAMDSNHWLNEALGTPFRMNPTDFGLLWQTHLHCATAQLLVLAPILLR